MLLCWILGKRGAGFTVQADATDMLANIRQRILDQEFKATPLGSSDLELFAAQETDGSWIHLGDKVVRELDEGAVPPRIQAIVDRGPLTSFATVVDCLGATLPTRSLHVLVRVNNQVTPFVSRPKRERLDSLFPPGSAKRTKLATDDPKPIEYFEMHSFPSMANPSEDFPSILIRDAYKVIYDEVLKDIHSKRGFNILVTGNPGIGKSRFYLYVIWRLTSEMEVLKSMVLVTNFGDTYSRLVADRTEFVELTHSQVNDLKRKRDVLRLIEGKSNYMDDWAGVSVLFASPGAPDIKYFKKRGIQYIMPPWNRVELEAYNALLSDSQRLSSGDLDQRFERFGGIARFIFADDKLRYAYALAMDQAIASNDALDIVKAGTERKSLDPKTHLLLVMVPDNPDCFQDFHLEFISKRVAAAVIEKLPLSALHQLSQFAFLHSEESPTAVARRFIHVHLGHRWFSLQDRCTLELIRLKTRAQASRSAGRVVQKIELCNPEVLLFDDVSSISLTSQPTRTKYYRSLSVTFPDALVVLPSGDCYCLQFTLITTHDIKMPVLTQLAVDLSVSLDQLKVVLVVPKAELSDFYREGS